jgi:hypothetical protein
MKEIKTEGKGDVNCLYVMQWHSVCVSPPATGGCCRKQNSGRGEAVEIRDKKKTTAAAPSHGHHLHQQQQQNMGLRLGQILATIIIIFSIFGRRKTKIFTGSGSHFLFFFERRRTTNDDDDNRRDWVLAGLFVVVRCLGN